MYRESLLALVLLLSPCVYPLGSSVLLLSSSCDSTVVSNFDVLLLMSPCRHHSAVCIVISSHPQIEWLLKNWE